VRAVRPALAPLRREESGLTLVELLMAAMIGLIVVGGAMTVFVGAIRSEPRTASRVEAIQDARVTVDRITRELRQGLEVPTAKANELAVITYVKAATCGGATATTSIPCRVTYTCAGDQCTRTVAQPNGSAPGSPTVVADALVDANVFSFSPGSEDPAYVGVTFELQPDEGDAVMLEDGVALRNLEEEEA
jgi:Tfp pilus assembly protein PilW